MTDASIPRTRVDFLQRRQNATRLSPALQKKLDSIVSTPVKVDDARTSSTTHSRTTKNISNHDANATQLSADAAYLRALLNGDPLPTLEHRVKSTGDPNTIDSNNHTKDLVSPRTEDNINSTNTSNSKSKSKSKSLSVDGTVLQDLLTDEDANPINVDLDVKNMDYANSTFTEHMPITNAENDLLSQLTSVQFTRITAPNAQSKSNISHSKPKTHDPVLAALLTADSVDSKDSVQLTTSKPAHIATTDIRIPSDLRTPVNKTRTTKVRDAVPTHDTSIATYVERLYAGDTSPTIVKQTSSHSKHTKRSNPSTPSSQILYVDEEHDIEDDGSLRAKVPMRSRAKRSSTRELNQACILATDTVLTNNLTANNKSKSQFDADAVHAEILVDKVTAKVRVATITSPLSNVVPDTLHNVPTAALSGLALDADKLNVCTDTVSSVSAVDTNMIAAAALTMPFAREVQQCEQLLHAVCAHVRAVLQHSNTTDFDWHGLNEAGFKMLVQSAVHTHIQHLQQRAEDFKRVRGTSTEPFTVAELDMLTIPTWESEVQLKPSAQFADLVFSWGLHVRLIVELKYIRVPQLCSEFATNSSSVGDGENLSALKTNIGTRRRAFLQHWIAQCNTWTDAHAVINATTIHHLFKTWDDASHSTTTTQRKTRRKQCGTGSASLLSLLQQANAQIERYVRSASLWTNELVFGATLVGIGPRLVLQWENTPYFRARAVNLHTQDIVHQLY